MAFIEELAGYVQKYAPLYGIKVCSPIIAQGIFESARGTSDKVFKNGKWRHNYFGLKWRNNRCAISNEYFEEWTAEQNPDGTYTNIVSRFCKFKSLEECVIGYFQWTDIPNYANLKGVTDPREYLENIKKDKYATSINYVENNMRVIAEYDLTKYDSKEEPMNSSLVDYTIKSPNNSGKRTSKICRITPHCVVGQLSAQGIGNCFANKSVQASCNYGIGVDGDVVLVVDECNRSWCSSSNDNDQKAVTIECASDRVHPYSMNTKVYDKLIILCTDICKRNGINHLLWLGSKEATLAYTPKAGEAVLTAHRWFKNKACPGDWLYSRYGDLANRVNAALGSAPLPAEKTKPLYKVQTGAFSKKDNARKQLEALKKKGFSGIIVMKGSLYKVQVGAYIVIENAEAMQKKLHNAGFEAMIITE